SQFSFAPDGSLIAVSTNKITQIIDPHGDIQAELRGDAKGFSPSGNYILMADVGMSTVYRFVRTADWKKETEITLDKTQLIQEFIQKGERLRFAWDDRSFAVMYLERVEIYTLPERKLTCSISIGEQILDIRFAPHGEKIAVLDVSGRITIWDTASGDRLSAQSSKEIDFFLTRFDLTRLSADGKLITIHPEWYDPALWKGELGKTSDMDYRQKLQLLEGNKRLVFNTAFFQKVPWGWWSTGAHEVCELFDSTSLDCYKFVTSCVGGYNEWCQSITLTIDGDYYVGKMARGDASLNIWQGKDLDTSKDTWKSFKAVGQSKEVTLHEIIPEKNFVFYELTSSTDLEVSHRLGAFNYDIRKAFAWNSRGSWGYATSHANRLLALVRGIYRSSKDTDGRRRVNYLFKINVLDLNDIKEVITKDIPVTYVVRNLGDYVEEKTPWIEVKSLVVSESKNDVMFVRYDKSGQNTIDSGNFSLVKMPIDTPDDLIIIPLDFPPIHNLEQYPFAITNVSYLEDQDLLALALVDGSIHILNSQDGSLIYTIKEFNETTSLAFSEDGNLLVSAHGKDGIAIWGVPPNR
ncbi:MAG: WD40 repeat domain-containing protein, partial [Anaerolineaceae bacterium]|nr:WD40 repeat domain-containing protein [Anaerolineaceae bacterium]